MESVSDNKMGMGESPRSFCPPGLDEDQMETLVDNFAKEDSFEGKTITRIVVERFLSKFSWYNPAQNYKNAPSLSKAYAYFEHITLPRHFVRDDQAGRVMHRAEPGESVLKTELYPAFTTPPSSLIEWGIGIDMYFSSIRLLGLLLLVAGLMHLPNAFFYASQEYSPDGRNTDFPLALKGTAVCTSGEWVVCDETCRGQWSSTDAEAQRYLTDGDTILVFRNTCNGGELQQGIVNWIVLVFLLVTISMFVYYLRAREIRFDEDKLTATDYSVLVANPPPNAIDPDEWRDFFNQFADKGGGVTAVTVALNNEELVQKLIYRRVHRNNLRIKLPKGVDMDDEDMVRSAVAEYMRETEAEPKGVLYRLFACTLLPLFNLFGMLLSADVQVDKVFALTEEIKELQQNKYDAVKVFVTFETEAGQRSALSALSVSRLDILLNRTDNVPPSIVFQDTVLKVSEPKEPNSIRWLDLSAGTIKRVSWRLINVAITVGIVSFAGFLVTMARYNVGTSLSSIMVSVFNSTIPIVVKILMMFEKHHTEGTFQSSLYLKITLFRWVNTALLTKLLTPFTMTLSDRKEDVIRQINAILWAELWLVPGMRLLDLGSNIKKHILAPRAHTQEEMNLWFQGTRFNLGERYTDLTKVLFVCFFYSALMPTIFFFGSAILFLQYFADIYCLTRIWGWSPSIGNELARFSRRYFFTGSLLAYAIVSAYAFAQFPYDNICDTTNQTPIDKFTYTNASYQNGTAFGKPIVVTQDTPVQFCDQSYSHFEGFIFPPTERVQRLGQVWMSDSQATLSNLYGFTALVLVIVYIIILFGASLRNFFLSWFHGVYVTDGQDQRIDFSANPEIFCYVPQIRWAGFPFPFLACDIDRIDQDLIGWNDPHRSYDHHNLMFDVPWEGMPRKKMINENTRAMKQIAAHEGFQENSNRLSVKTKSGQVSAARPIFSVISHYPPEWVLKLRDDENGKKAD